MILHTLNASPSSAAFGDCLRIATGGDAILLMGDAVYGAVESTEACAVLLATGADLYILSDDARAAGTLPFCPTAKHVEMAGFVALSEQFARQMAWY